MIFTSKQIDGRTPDQFTPVKNKVNDTNQTIIELLNPQHKLLRTDQFDRDR